MFYHVRYQTGELDDIVKEMTGGNIPCVDVSDNNELDWVIDQLKERGILKVEGLPYDRNARDVLAEPEFEFRIAFSRRTADLEAENKDLMYADFYFEPIIDDTYDPCGEL